MTTIYKGISITTSSEYICFNFPNTFIAYANLWTRSGLTRRQNKHVLSASKGGRGVQQKSGHKPIYFISQILGSKTHQKYKKCRKNEIEH
jgi:uncharacterized membrane protein